MQVISVRFHYFLVSPNIIWLSSQYPLTNWKIRYRSIICRESAFIWCKDCENWSSTSGDIRRNTPVFLAMSYLTFANEFCQLWSYWTEFHEIFTRYRGIIFAVKGHIEVVISYSLSECESEESGVFAIFLTKSVAMATTLAISEKKVQMYHLHQKRFLLV